jgi:peptidylprolyl isomerase
MSQAKTGDTVKVFYTGKLDDGTVFDSNVGQEAMEFKIGEGMLLPGFEDAVLGLETGGRATAKIPAAEGYGLVQEEMIVVLNRSEMPKNLDPKVGQRLQFGSPEGKVVVVVTNTTPETVTVDGNHPLAGKDLTFEIELAEIV